MSASNDMTHLCAPDRVYLVGFMATGKTTLGRAVASRAGYEFIDLDQHIEADTGMSVSQYFARYGEASFRRRESDTLASLARMPGKVIIACGGGTPCNPRNMSLMNATGLTVCLYAPIERIVERLRLTPGTRPLIDALPDDAVAAYVSDKLAERARYYDMAHSRFDASLLEDARQIEDTARRFIATYINVNSTNSNI